jgi:hypothetical protein
LVAQNWVFVDFKALVLANHRTRQAAQSSEGGYVFTVLRTTVVLCADARLRDFGARRSHSYVTIHCCTTALNARRLVVICFLFMRDHGFVTGAAEELPPHTLPTRLLTRQHPSPRSYTAVPCNCMLQLSLPCVPMTNTQTCLVYMLVTAFDVQQQLPYHRP